MEEKISLIVKFQAKEEKLDCLKSELLKILEPTRKEFGCLLYELHQDLDNPTILMFYEIWENELAWKMHNTSKHITDFKVAIEDCVESVLINRLTVI
jgi:quinol monooxygenase YgiN